MHQCTYIHIYSMHLYTYIWNIGRKMQTDCFNSPCSVSLSCISHKWQGMRSMRESHSPRTHTLRSNCLWRILESANCIIKFYLKLFLRVTAFLFSQKIYTEQMDFFWWTAKKTEIRLKKLRRNKISHFRNSEIIK